MNVLSRFGVCTVGPDWGSDVGYVNATGYDHYRKSRAELGNRRDDATGIERKTFGVVVMGRICFDNLLPCEDHGNCDILFVLSVLHGCRIGVSCCRCL